MNQQRRGTIATVRSLEKRQSINSSRRRSSRRLSSMQRNRSASYTPNAQFALKQRPIADVGALPTKLNFTEAKTLSQPARTKFMTQTNRTALIKYCIFAFNLIFIIVGFGLVCLGVFLKADERFRDFLSEKYRNVAVQYDVLYIGAYLLIVIGFLMIIVSFFGCCGSIRLHRCLLISYFICLAVLFVTQLSVGTVLYIKRDSIENELGETLDYMVSKYYQGPSIVQEALEALHKAFRCCGSSGCSDFDQLNLRRPRSCDAECEGCRLRMFRALRDSFTVLSVVFAFVLLAEIFGMILAMYLACVTVPERVPSPQLPPRCFSVLLSLLSPSDAQP
ncbi:CD9 antigen [Trichinella pseudospiralis]